MNTKAPFAAIFSTWRLSCISFLVCTIVTHSISSFMRSHLYIYFYSVDSTLWYIQRVSIAINRHRCVCVCILDCMSSKILNEHVRECDIFFTFRGRHQQEIEQTDCEQNEKKTHRIRVKYKRENFVWHWSSGFALPFFPGLGFFGYNFLYGSNDITYLWPFTAETLSQMAHLRAILY